MEASVASEPSTALPGLNPLIESDATTTLPPATFGLVPLYWPKAVAETASNRIKSLLIRIIFFMLSLFPVFYVNINFWFR
jgi:hypothetical protein